MSKPTTKTKGIILMQTLIPNSELLKALTGLSMIVPRKSKIPILSHVLVKVSDGVTTLCATDLDQYASCAITDAQADGDFAVLIPFSGLRDFARLGAKNGGTLVSLEGDSIRLADVSRDKIGVVRTFPLLSAVDFPLPPALPEKLFGLDPKMIQAFRLFQSSASVESTRPTLQGIQVTAKSVAASDGQQLAFIEFSTGFSDEVIVPCTRLLASNLLGSDCRVGIGFKDESTSGKPSVPVPCSLTLASSCWVYQVRLIDGSFPNWRQVVPVDSSLIETISILDPDPCDLIRQIGRLGKGDDAFGTLRLQLVADTRLRVSPVDSPEGGFEIKITRSGSESDRTIFIRRNLLVSALTLGHRTIRLSSDDVFPVLFEGGFGKHVAMPVRYKSNKTPETNDERTKSDAVSDTRSKAVETSVTPESITNHPMKKENAPMNHERQNTVASEERKTEAKSAESRVTGFTVIPPVPTSAESDPFDELLNFSNQLRDHLSALQTLQRDLPRKIKAAQIHLKDKERDYRQTRDILDKLKKVSGF
jgi:DNA polymerase III sliding clamp (beta) subunit (PCNA family)